MKNPAWRKKRATTNFAALKPNQKVIMYHSTNSTNAKEMVNGFDTNKMVKSHYHRTRYWYKGMYVSPEILGQFGGIIFKLALRTNNLHGTDYSANIGRPSDPQAGSAPYDKEIAYRKKYAKEDYPNSFRPYLSQTLLQKTEPQALYRGIVSPDMILGVMLNYGDNKGKWLTRKQFMKLQDIEDEGFDLSSPNYTIDQYLDFMGGRRMDRKRIVKILQMRFQWDKDPTRRDDNVDKALDQFGFGASAKKSLIHKFKRKYGDGTVKTNPALKVGDRIKEGGKTGKVVAFHTAGTVDVKFDGDTIVKRRQMRQVHKANPRRGNGKSPYRYLYHATTGGGLILIKRSRAIQERPSHRAGGATQAGISTAHDVDALTGGDFGKYILKIDTQQLPPNRRYENVDYWGDDREKEIRVYGGKIPLNAVVEIIRLGRLAMGDEQTFKSLAIPYRSIPRRRNPEPERAQLEAQVQGIYGSQVRGALGLPYNHPFIGPRGGRLDSRLSKKKRREALSAAFGIATDFGREHGYLIPSPDPSEPYPVIPTQKGLRRSAERIAHEEEYKEDMAKYEESLRLARKGNPRLTSKKGLPSSPYITFFPQIRKPYVINKTRTPRGRKIGMIPTAKKPVEGQRGWYLPKAKKGQMVAVYFNLNDMYNGKYGMVPVSNTEYQRIKKEARGIALKRKKSGFDSWAAKWTKMELSGSIYSVMGRNGLIVDHVRSGAMRGVVFTTSLDTIESIRRKETKKACCYIDGSWEGKLTKPQREYFYRKAVLQGDLEDWVEVRFNPMYNTTFVYVEQGKYIPIYTAEEVVFLSNPFTPLATPPHLILARGINLPQDKHTYIGSPKIGVKRI